jgi:ABC-type uncharacterized transport system permease subunit
VKRARRVGELFAGTLGLMITLGISFLIAIVLIFLLSKDPLTTIYYFFVGPFTNKYYFGNMLNTAIPLVFTGLGIAVAFKSSVFNLGGLPGRSRRPGRRPGHRSGPGRIERILQDEVGDR